MTRPRIEPPTSTNDIIISITSYKSHVQWQLGVKCSANTLVAMLINSQIVHKQEAHPPDVWICDHVIFLVHPLCL